MARGTPERPQTSQRARSSALHNSRCANGRSPYFVRVNKRRPYEDAHAHKTSMGHPAPLRKGPKNEHGTPTDKRTADSLHRPQKARTGSE